jgi:hypothetical protein
LLLLLLLQVSDTDVLSEHIHICISGSESNTIQLPVQPHARYLVRTVAANAAAAAAAASQVGKTDVLSELRHREPITAISWQYSGQEARRRASAAASYRLFTLGADGRLLVWRWDQLSNPVYG